MGLRLLGATAWWLEGVAGGGAAPTPLTRKDAALLTVLALDGPVARDRLAALLWPDVPLDRARTNLRQRLYRLRRDSGQDIAVGTDTLSLAPAVSHDLAEPDPALAGSEAGELLGGHDYGDTDLLDTWVTQARAAWRSRQADALASAAARHEAAGELASAIGLTERLLALSPLLETAWRRLMWLHYLRGDRCAAIAAFERFEQLLKQELGSRPSAETIAQLALIERSDAAPAAAVQRPRLPASLVRPPVLVGRERDLRAMARAWEAGKAFLLIGQAGMGKSRLLGDFLAGRPGVVQETGRPGDERSPYATVARLLRQVLAVFPAALMGSAATGPEGAAPRPAFRQELARLLPELGPVPSAPGHQLPLWRAAEQLLEQAHAAGLCALVLDDLQFADAASQELLRWLLASPALHSLRLAFATRPLDGLGQTASPWLHDSARPEPVELLPLDAPQVQALLASLDLTVPLGTPHTELAAALFRHAGGHPFYTLETLKDLVLHGPAPLTAPASLPLPATVQTLIERRLALLTPAALDLARVAAVLGQGLNADTAAHMLGTRPLSLATPWAELEAANVLQGPRFAHDLVREVLVARLPAAVQTALHAAAARALQHQAQVPPGRIAQHWWAAGQWHAAGPALQAAAEAAHRAGRLLEHGELLLQAAEAFERAGQPGPRFDALRRRLDGLLVREGGLSVIEAAPQLAPLATDRRQRAELMQVEIEALLNQARFADVVARATTFRDLCEGFEALEPEALSLTGCALASLGRTDEARPLLEQALARAQSLAARGGHTKPLGRAWDFLGHLAFWSGRVADAVHCYGEALRHAQALGDPADHAILSANLATVLWMQGDNAAALAQARGAHTAYSRLDAQLSPMAAINLLNLGLTAWAQGQLGEALPALHAALEALGDTAPVPARAKARNALAEVWLQLGQPEAAWRVLAGGAPGKVGIGDAALAPEAEPLPGLPLLWEALWRWSLARVLKALGQSGAAAAQTAQTLALARQLPDLSTSPLLLLAHAAELPRPQALALLDAQADQAEQRGRSGLTRSLQLAAALRATQAGPDETPEQLADALARARQCLAQLEAPHHAITWPPRDWQALAQVLGHLGARAEARALHARTAAWCQAAVASLPPGLWPTAVSVDALLSAGNAT